MNKQSFGHKNVRIKNERILKHYSKIKFEYSNGVLVCYVLVLMPKRNLWPTIILIGMLVYTEEKEDICGFLHQQVNGPGHSG